jgi:hypothetical protein
LDAITTDHARAFLHTGDAILGVLLNAYEGKQPDLAATREPYGSFPHLDDRIDRAVSIGASIEEGGDSSILVLSIATGPENEALLLRVEPSRLLYGVDREAYLEVLKIVALGPLEVEELKDEPDEAPAVPGAAVVVVDSESSQFAGPVAELVPTYAGRLAGLRPGIENLLIEMDLPAGTQGDAGNRLVDSLMATAEQNMGLDWNLRDSMRARLRVALRRVVLRFGSDAAIAEAIAERMVRWLLANAADAEVVTERRPAAGGRGV